MNKLKNKKGLVLPLAILTLFLTTAFIYYGAHFLLDYYGSKNASYLNELASSQANNALVYGLNSLNTPLSKDGNKCTKSWYDTKNSGEIEITYKDEGLTEFQNGLKVRRFFSLKGTTDWHNAFAHGIARVYDSSNNLVAEKTISTRVDLIREMDDGELYKAIESKCLTQYSDFINTNIRNFCSKGYSTSGGWSQTEAETMFYTQLRSLVTTEVNAGRKIIADDEEPCYSGAMAVKKETWGVS